MPDINRIAQVRSMAFVSPPTYQLTWGDLNNQYNGSVTVTLNQYVLCMLVSCCAVC